MDEENKHRFCNATFSFKGYLKTHEDSIHKKILTPYNLASGKKEIGL